MQTRWAKEKQKTYAHKEHWMQKFKEVVLIFIYFLFLSF